MKIVNGFLVALGIIAVVAFILGFPLMILWNWLMPSIFGLREIGFWEAIGMNVLAYILFGKTSPNTKS